MASPFDFSSFLLTPPIPNYSNGNNNGSNTSSSSSDNSGNKQSKNHIEQQRDHPHNENSGYQLTDSTASTSYQPMTQSNLSASAPTGSGFPMPGQFSNVAAHQQHDGSIQSGGYGTSNHDYSYSQRQQNQYSQNINMQRNDGYRPQQSIQQQQHQPQQQQQQYEQTYQQQQQQQQSQPYYTGDQSNAYGAVDPSGYPNYGDALNLQQQPQSHPQQQQQQHSQQQQQQSQHSYLSNSLPSSLPPVASGSSTTQHNMTAGKMPSLDERDYGLDPSAFSSVSFQMPSFLAASSQPGEYGVGSDGPSVVDPSAFHQPAMQNVGPFPSFLTAPPAQQPPQQINSAPPNAFMQPQQQQQQPSTSFQQQGGKSNTAPTLSAIASAKKPSNKYVPDLKNPVYGIYGSSVISVNPDMAPFKLALNAAAAIPNPIAPEEPRSGTPDFDPKSLGLPVGEQLFPQPLPGLYSSSGFDMLGVLARVAARPNPQINIGPVDTSCSFLVVDARRYDMPIVFASDTFSKLTGYSNVRNLEFQCSNRVLTNPLDVTG